MSRPEALSKITSSLTSSQTWKLQNRGTGLEKNCTTTGGSDKQGRPNGKRWQTRSHQRFGISTCGRPGGGGPWGRTPTERDRDDLMPSKRISSRPFRRELEGGEITTLYLCSATRKRGAVRGENDGRSPLFSVPRTPEKGQKRGQGHGWGLPAAGAQAQTVWGNPLHHYFLEQKTVTRGNRNPGTPSLWGPKSQKAITHRTRKRQSPKVSRVT